MKREKKLMSRGRCTLPFSPRRPARRVDDGLRSGRGGAVFAGWQLASATAREAVAGSTPTCKLTAIGPRGVCSLPLFGERLLRRAARPSLMQRLTLVYRTLLQEPIRIGVA